MSMEKYIVIQSFMIQDLKLKGNELIVYAILYGFSQDGKTAFNGSLSYISDWIGCSKRQAINILQSLEKKELISKKQFKENNVLQNLYYCRIERGSEKISLSYEKISLRGSEKISLLPIFNNNNNNNNKSKVDLDKKEEEDFFAEAEKNSMWREQVCMNLKIDDFEKEFAEFRKDCIMLASQHNSEQDVQRHFLFWYRKKKREDKERSKTINNNNSLTKTAEQW